MTEQKGFKVSIIPSLKKSYLLAYAERKRILSYSWVPVLFLLLLTRFDAHLAISQNYLDKWSTMAYDSSVYELITVVYEFLYGNILDSLVYALIAVGLYRYLVLGEERVSFFKCSRKEIYMFSLSFLLGVFVFLAGKANQYLFGSILIEFGEYDIITDMSFLPWVFNGIEFIIIGFVAASLIFIWPTVSTTEGYTYKNLINVVRAVKGNVIRVFIVQLIIVLPAYIVSQITFNVMYHIEPFLNDFEFWVISHMIAIINDVVLYTFVCIDIVFISVLYKSLKDSGRELGS